MGPMEERPLRILAADDSAVMRGVMWKLFQRHAEDRSSELPRMELCGVALDGVDLERLAVQTPGLTFDVTRDAAEASKIGISQVEWAIADTGTLVTDAAPVERRLVSTLPVIHVAVVATDAIEADMPEALARIHPNQCGYISIITGPSRTADIERVLTIGVHGPSRLIIVFVDELGRN